MFELLALGAGPFSIASPSMFQFVADVNPLFDATSEETPELLTTQPPYFHVAFLYIHTENAYARNSTIFFGDSLA